MVFGCVKSRNPVNHKGIFTNRSVVVNPTVEIFVLQSIPYRDGILTTTEPDYLAGQTEFTKTVLSRLRILH